MTSTFPLHVIIHVKNAYKQGKKAVVSRDSPTVAICARSIKPYMTVLVARDAWKYLVKSLRNNGLQKRRFESLESLRMRTLSSVWHMILREDAGRVALADSATSTLVTAGGFTLPRKVSP